MAVTPAATPMPALMKVGGGELWGQDNAWTPNDGNSSVGGHGQAVLSNGLSFPCNTMKTKYHIHAFVGVIVNGRQLAMADGAGMNRYSADHTMSGGFKYWTDPIGCVYYLHMHDPSGVIHVESPATTASNSTALYTLGNFFDIWGMKLSTTQIGSYTGTVRVYVARVPLNTNPVPNTKYVLYTGNPRSIPLHSHTTTWLEIGPTYVTPSHFPAIQYYEQY